LCFAAAELVELVHCWLLQVTSALVTGVAGQQHKSTFLMAAGAAPPNNGL
jgi:hypothetical protein